MNVIVWDIETVPDLRGFAAANDLAGEADAEVLEAIGVGERTEKQLISAFVDRIAELNPQFVTFNGHSFDLPVLRYRAMINGISGPGLSARP